ncbi:hypothetical protein A2U01_0062991 [Trifolium medium]|uniref:Uncharacterized protein n=1 Tax=Trifolium medium TaxID=97028 RepID=A0A392S027_9FABA|nr:hypothetical protein [Trifolium medium]
MSVFKTFEEDLVKAEEEKRRLEEEEKNKLEEQQKILSENVASEDKGKEVVTEPHPLVLVLQEQLEAQKIELEKIKEDIRNHTEGQEHVIKTQEDISSKLNAILAHLSRQP